MNVRYYVAPFCTLLLATGCGTRPTAQANHVVAQGMDMQITTNPAPPHSGDDTLILNIKDASTGAVIGNANVTATASMTSPVTQGASVSGRSQGGGRYEVPMRLAVATTYAVEVHVDVPGRTSAVFTVPLNAEH